jgi:hypothetical protein
MSSDTREANSSYCGPEPFTIQSWLVNSTVRVQDAAAGSGASVLAFTTGTRLPSSPTGKVTSGTVGVGFTGWGSVFAALGVVLGMMA